MAREPLANRRLNEHRSRLCNGKHSNRRLLAAFKKHGPLKMEVLIVCRESDLVMYEQICLDAFQPRYNLSMLADRVEWTDEMRAKVRAIFKSRPGRKPTDEERARQSASKLAARP